MDYEGLFIQRDAKPITNGEAATKAQNKIDKINEYLTRCHCFEKDRSVPTDPSGRSMIQIDCDRTIEKLTDVLKEYYKTDETSWKLVQQTGTAQAYQDYLDNYPNGKHITIASSNVNKMRQENQQLLLKEEIQDCQDAIKANDLIHYKNYAEKYPNGKFIYEISQKINAMEALHYDSITFQDALISNSSKAYKNYLSSFPAGLFIKEATDSSTILVVKEAKLDSVAYIKAKKLGTLESYKEYELLFPNGAYISKVQAIINSLEAKEAQAKEQQDRVEVIIYQICTNSITMSRCQEILDQENEVGARSGYVNAATIQENTRSIIVLEGSIKKLKAEYLQITKKAFSSKLCTQEVLDNNPSRYYKRYQTGPRIERGQ